MTEQTFWIVVFWLGVLGGVFSYFVYPMLLAVAVRMLGRPVESGGSSPLPLTVIVAVHNEEGKIEGKLSDLFDGQYEAQKLEVIVASDASTDRTDDIVRSFGDQRVTLVRQPERKGKESAQGLALKSVSKDRIVVFSDAGTNIQQGSLNRMSEIFSCNSDVGAISSEDAFLQADGTPSAEGAYVRYEMWLRRMESQLGGLVGLSGSFFAARREVCDDWRSSIPSDFNVAINARRAGFRSVSDRGVVGIYKSLSSNSAEYGRKVRTVTRGMAALASNPGALNPLRYGGFALQVLSHKVMRWLVPVFFLQVAVSGLFLWDAGSVYRFALFAQGVLLSIAAIGKLFPGLQSSSLIRTITYFVEVNVAIVHAFLLAVRGKRVTYWSPSKR